MREQESTSSSSVEPFLKWAGGKRWFVKNHASLLPTKFKRYFEPFLGSGAVFFHLRPRRAILADTNRHLVETYEALKKNWRRVQRALDVHQSLHSREHYYEVRKAEYRGPYQRAAQFIYLNRTCWNGLYRVNFAGQFNVPVGTRSNVVRETDRFEVVSQCLERANMYVEDFASVIERAHSGDFLFVDPPYTVQHNNNNFVKYNENLFSWDDQRRLRESLTLAKRRGVLIMITNANHHSVADLFREIGPPLVLRRSSTIAGDPGRRRDSEELVIRSW